MKKLIIRMVNGDQYQIHVENNDEEYVIERILDKIRKYASSRKVKIIRIENEIYIDKKLVIKIKYVSGFVIYCVKSVAIQVDNISSIELIKID